MLISGLNYKKQLFAFIDVLGFSEHVKASETNEDSRNVINNFYSICQDMFSWQKEIPGYENIRFMIMSDSIVASLPINGELDLKSFRNFCFFLARFQNELAWFN